MCAMTTKTRPSVEQLRASIISARAEVEALLKDTQYTVEITDRLSSQNPFLVLTLTSRRMSDREFHPVIQIKSHITRYETEPSGISITIPGNHSRHSRDRVYTNLNKANYQKIKAYLVEREETIFGTMERKRAAEADENRWNGIRATELNGVIEPPGMDTHIIMGNGPEAGKYRVRFHSMGVGLEQAALTPEQVKRLANLVNEFLNTSDYHVIMAAWPEQEKRVYMWTESAGWREGSTKAIKLIKSQDLPAELEKAKANAGHQWKVKALTYAQAFTITP